MIKKIFLLASICMFAIACSNDETDVMTNNKATSKILKSNSSDISKVLGYLYSNDFTYGKVLTIEDGVASYKVTEVFVNGEVELKGYIVETSAEEVYIEHKGNGIINEYHSDSVNIVRTVDVSGDPIYQRYGFEADPEYGIGEAPARFWGWGEWQYGDCKNGTRNAIRIYHVLWLSFDYEIKSEDCE